MPRWLASRAQADDVSVDRICSVVSGSEHAQLCPGRYEGLPDSTESDLSRGAGGFYFALPPRVKVSKLGRTLERGRGRPTKHILRLCCETALQTQAQTKVSRRVVFWKSEKTFEPMKRELAICARWVRPNAQTVVPHDFATSLTRSHSLWFVT
jgi:hypothetical protein